MPDRLRPETRSRQTLRSSQDWRKYFCANAARPSPIPWDVGVALSERERAIVARSLATFQLGETGTGRHILRAAERYADRSGDVDYPAALQLFFAEEHRHASDLGRVLDLAGLPRVRKHWADVVFRCMRHIVGFEGALCILLTPELIAMIYYAALREATASSVLRRLCERILRDEAMHIRFHTERLALLRRRRSWLALRITLLLQAALFVGACGAFWISHHGVLRAGRFGWRRMFRRAHNVWAAAVRWMDPELYAVPPARISDRLPERDLRHVVRTA
jgi:hypothetical protein